MKWGRYIKRTVVRRIVWVVVGLAVYALLGMVGKAWGQTAPPNSGTFDSRGEAYAACMVWADYVSARDGYPTDCRHLASGNVGNYRARNSNTGTEFGGFFAYLAQCPDGGVWDEDLKRCNDCASRPQTQYNINTSIWGAPSSVCESSCEYALGDPQCTLVDEGSTAGYWCNFLAAPTGQVCTGSDAPPPDPDAPPPTCGADEVRLPDGNCSPRGQCPVGQHEVNGECHPSGRCPTGHVKAPDGSCAPESCPAGQARGADGTCKSDSNEDGTPDEDEEGGDGTNTDGMEFSGGESCSVPPTCSGDAIMCGQARIQWRIDCNTRKNTSGHGGMSCSPADMPVCVGEHCDWTEHQQLIQQWKTACALADLSQGDGVGDGDLTGVEERLDGIGSFLDGGGDCLASPGGCGPGDGDLWDEEAPEAESWSSGLSSTGSCPAPISTTITIGGHSTPIEFSYQPICDFAALMRWVLIAAATIMSSFIVAGVRNS